MQRCVDLGFNETTFPNLIEEASQEDAIGTFDAFFFPEIETCGSDALFFICSLQFPKCENNQKMKPCKRLCNGTYISY